jgi:integrase
VSPKLRRYLKIRDELLSMPISEAPPPYFILNDNGERVTENTLRRRLYSWVRKSGLKKAGIKPHDLRRTFGTWFLQANPGHVREIAELMGHSDLSVVDDTVSDDFRDLRHGGHGKQAMKQVILTLRESFADLEVSVERHGQVTDLCGSI